MLPGTWHTPRLLIQDATAADLKVVHASLAESQDVADLDPTFALVSPAEVEAHITRSAEGGGSPSRPFQMQVLRLSASDDVAGYWHFMTVPKKPTTIGISIILIRPAYRRQGLGSELIQGALSKFEQRKQEIWARVYLGNVCSIEFWADLGFLSLTRHKDSYVSSPQERPSIILSRQLHSKISGA